MPTKQGQKLCYTPEELRLAMQVVKRSSKRRRTVSIPVASKPTFNPMWLVYGIAGIGVLYLVRKATLAPVVTPVLPTPIPLPTAIPPQATPPSAPKMPVAVWSPNKKTLNSLEGYHRAKQAEVSREPEILNAATIAVSREAGRKYGDLIFGKTTSGVEYAIAIEEHTNHPPKPNLGASLFIKNIGVA